MQQSKTEGTGGPWGGLGDLDKLLEHRVRLAICVLLSRNDMLSFRRLQKLLGETDGSLGAQLRKLEDNRYLTVKKEFRDRRPVSWYSLSEDGRSALLKHLSVLERLISEASSESKPRN